MISNVAKTGYVIVSALTAYTVMVEVNNQVYYKRKKTMSKDFLGITDMLILDNLQTGDLILFDRKWYRYHVFTACHILWMKYILKSSFDHAGMIIQNEFGESYIYENTPIKGPKLLPFDQRIYLSKSAQIVAIPLLPRPIFSKPKLGLLQQHISNNIRSVHFMDSEIIQTFSFSIKNYLNKIFLVQKHSKYHPSIKIISDSFAILGYQLIPLSCENDESLKENTQVISIRDIFRETVYVCDTNSETIESRKKYHLGNHVLLRTS